MFFGKSRLGRKTLTKASLPIVPSYLARISVKQYPSFFNLANVHDSNRSLNCSRSSSNSQVIAFEYLSLCALYAPCTSSLDWPRDLVVFFFLFFSPFAVASVLLVPIPNKYPYFSSALLFAFFSVFVARAHSFSLSSDALESNPSIFLVPLFGFAADDVFASFPAPSSFLFRVLVIKSDTVFFLFSFAGRTLLLLFAAAAAFASSLLKAKKSPFFSFARTTTPSLRCCSRRRRHE